MKLCVDLSSILWTCLRVGKDTDGQEVIHKEKKVWVNSAAYGYEFAVNLVVTALKEFGLTPIDCIFVQEGVSSKAPRLAICSKYKANRDDKPVEELKEFHKLKDMFLGVFSSLGSIVLVQDYAEGDDTLGYLALHSEEDLIIVTNDNDLAALNGKNSFGAEIAVRVNGFMGVNKYGDFPYHHITLYKAMVGDTSDGISGIPGFGPKAWELFATRFGVAGMDMLVAMIGRRSLDDLFNDAQQDKFVKKIFDGADDLIRCYKLARIYPEWVNTQLNPLQWKPGMVAGRVSDERLKPWAASRRLVSAKNWEAFKPWALQQIAKRPWSALDIETSTPDQSDEWLEAQGDPDGVDVIGSQLSGMSLTFGANMHYTVYIAVDHAETDCVPSEALRDFIAEVGKLGTKLVIQNTNFEGPVLYNAWGKELADNGYRGFLPNWTDTKFWASYVDENDKLGLKHLSKKWLGYDQVDYATTTTLQALPGVLKGGKFKGEVLVVDKAAVHEVDEDGVSVIVTPEVSHMEERIQYKMRELSASHVFDYACDDTVTTAALYNFFKLWCDLEHTSKVVEEVEIKASYLHAHAYVTGARVDLVKLNELMTEDRTAADTAGRVLDQYLISRGWEGTICPVYQHPITASDLKQAYEIITGEELKTAVRTPSKVLAMVEAPLLRGVMQSALAGDVTTLNTLVATRFNGAPVLNLGSPKQMQKLLYETMGLTAVVFNQPTELMRKAGLREGSPKTDNLAITYALLECSEELKPVLEALRVIKMVNTRFSLYYDTLPGFVHWKTGRVHSSHNQCATNTRRASSSKPNLQQLSKTEKIEGFSPRIRELYIPHKKGAVIVSLDFSSQELVLMAEWSRDPTLVSCFVGDNLIDMHSKTGVGVHNNLHGTEYSYEIFVDILAGEPTAEQKRAKKSRALGKAVNFGSQYRIAAKKLSTMLLVTEAEAQAMLDAKAEAFPTVEQWSLNEMDAVKHTGTVKTMLGAVRHLSSQLMSRDKFISSKAPRQALSFRIQGSAAEQTKLVEGYMFSAGLLDKYDCEYIGPCHDEVIWSVSIEDLPEFIPEAHALMTTNYAGMEMPIRSSCSVGYSFGEQHELNGDFSKENIYKALGIQPSPTNQGI